MKGVGDHECNLGESKIRMMHIKKDILGIKTMLQQEAKLKKY